MKPVMQTVMPTESKSGNSFAASLASVLELKLDEVPHFMDNPNWRQLYQEWLGWHGLAMIEVMIDEPVPLMPLPEGVLFLVAGLAKRDLNRMHVVVARTLKGEKPYWSYIHDPHPSQTYLLNPKRAFFFVPIHLDIVKN